MRALRMRGQEDELDKQVAFLILVTVGYLRVTQNFLIKANLGQLRRGFRTMVHDRPAAPVNTATHDSK
jgi:hypothetical protein